MGKIFSIVLTLALLISPAFGQSPFSGSLLNAPTSTPSYAGPGDIVAFTAWYGLRAYSAAVAAGGTTKAINIFRTSDSQTCDVLIDSTGGLGNTTGCSGSGSGTLVATFCASVTCRILKLYDQTAGNACSSASCDFTVGDFISFTMISTNCGGLPYCMLMSGDITSAANNFTPSAAKLTFSTVAQRNTGTRFNNFVAGFGSNNILQSTDFTNNSWTLSGGTSGAINAAATDAVWHTGIGVLNGASSVLTIDGTDTTGTVVASTSAGTPTLRAVPGNGIWFEECGVIDNVAITGTQRTNLNAQQRAYWGF